MDNKDQNFPEYEPNEELDELMEIDDDQEFEKRLEAYNGPGDKDYMRVTRKRILDASKAYDLIEEAEAKITGALDLLLEANTGTTRTRGLSLAITSIEQGVLWMNSVAYAVAPHDMNSTDPITDAR